MSRMPKQSVLKACFGGILSFASLLNKIFGWLRSFDWLQQNAPSLWNGLVSPIVEYLPIIVGVALSARGLWEI